MNVNKADAPNFGIDSFGRVNEWNDETAEITGYSRVQLQRGSWKAPGLYLHCFETSSNCDKHFRHRIARKRNQQLRAGVYNEE